MVHPHQAAKIFQTGVPLEQAGAVMVLVHGRGATAYDILSLAEEFERDDFTYIAPQAAGNTWYPFSFMNPINQNEPHLSSALSLISDILSNLGSRGFPPEKVILTGFSQGACLVTEYAARNATRYGGIVGLSGGLIGPDGTPRDYQGNFSGTPIFLGCSDVDFHIPKERVQETTRVLGEMGAVVTERLYAGMGHTVNRDEIEFVQKMSAELISGR